MSYQALYRKWRPMVFDDVVGQQHITATIKNEILNNKISHAYLFTGTRGTGKTSTAKIFSRAVNCLNPKDGNPCNECELCKGILNERILDVLEIDAASNTGVENIRDIIEQTKYAAAEGKYRVYIIDEVHMLSQGAFNALLKTLEEPTPGVIFILATTEIHKVPATIMSRCQRFDFKTINIMDIVSRIQYILEKENISVDDDAIYYVSRLGEGSMRDSLSILDQCLAFKNNNLTYEDVVNTVGAVDSTYLYDIACYIAENNVKGAISVFEKCIADGKNTDHFSQGLLDVYRSILLYKVSEDTEYAGLRLENTQRAAEKYTVERLMYCVELITKLLGDIKFASSARVYIEMAIVKLATPSLDDSTSALLARISELEDTIRSGNINCVSSVSQTENNESDVPWYEDEEIEIENKTQDETEEKPVEAVQEEKEDKVLPEETAEEGFNTLDKWPDVEAEIIKNGKINLYMAVRGVSAYVSGDVLQLVFESAEKRDDCTKPENKEALKECVETVLGSGVEIEYMTKTQFAEVKGTDSGDVFGKIEQFSKEFPENIEI